MIEVILILLKWLFWLGAAGMLCLGLFMTLIVGKGLREISDVVLFLFYVAVIGFPGVLIHFVQKRMP